MHIHILSFFYVKSNIQNMAFEGGSLSPIEAPSRLARNQHHSGKHVVYLPCVYTALPVISITAFTIIFRLLLYSTMNLPFAIIIRLFYLDDCCSIYYCSSNPKIEIFCQRLKIYSLWLRCSHFHLMFIKIQSCLQKGAWEGSCLNAIEAQSRLANKYDTVQHVSLWIQLLTSQNRVSLC